MNHVLTPFSYALDGGEIFDVEENVAVENEIIEDEEVEDVEEDLEDTENTISESLESDTEQEEIDSLDTDNRETWEEDSSETEEDNSETEEDETWNEEWNDEENLTWEETEETDNSQSSTIVILLAQKLWIDREEDAKYYAELAWIDRLEYEWTREQNEQIRDFLIEHEEEILNGDFDEIIAEKKAEDEEWNIVDYSQYEKESRVAI